MKKKWQLQEAKNKFCKVAEQAIEYGPQVVTKRGKEAVVILSVEEYEQLRKRKDSLAEFLRKSPMKGVDLDLSRGEDTGRTVDL
jgi:prevent-host-death family protein